MQVWTKRQKFVRKMQKKMGDFFGPLSPHPTPALPVLIGVRNAGTHHAPMTKPEKIAVRADTFRNTRIAQTATTPTTRVSNQFVSMC